MIKSTIEPLMLECLDGEKRQFLLSMRTMRELAKSGIQTTTSTAEFIVVALHKALVDSALSEDDLAEVLPPDTDLLINFWTALVKHCSAKGNDQYRPTIAGASQNGSSSSVSGASGSDSQ